MPDNTNYNNHHKTVLQYNIYGKRIMSEKDIDIEMGELKQGLDSLVDETIDSSSGNSTQLIHHVDGDSSNKLVIGTSGKGKAFISDKN